MMKAFLSAMVNVSLSVAKERTSRHAISERVHAILWTHRGVLHADSRIMNDFACSSPSPFLPVSLFLINRSFKMVQELPCKNNLLRILRSVLRTGHRKF